MEGFLMPEKIDLEHLLKSVKGSNHLDALFSSFNETVPDLDVAQTKAQELYPDSVEKQEVFMNGFKFAKQIPIHKREEEPKSPRQKIGFQPNP